MGRMVFSQISRDAMDYPVKFKRCHRKHSPGFGLEWHFENLILHNISFARTIKDTFIRVLESVPGAHVGQSVDAESRLGERCEMSGEMYEGGNKRAPMRSGRKRLWRRWRRVVRGDEARRQRQLTRLMSSLFPRHPLRPRCPIQLFSPSRRGVSCSPSFLT